MKRLGRRAERGAVLLEFALVSIVLLLLAFGTTEFGMAWQDKSTVETAARAGVRVGSNLTTNSQADYNILQAVNSALHDVGAANVQTVVIYKSTTADGVVPTACKTASVATSCNRYTGAQLTALSPSQFGCGVGALDLSWCPTTRQNVQAVGLDYLGVWIKMSHPQITKLFGTTLTITDSAVMRLEPLT